MLQSRSSLPGFIPEVHTAAGSINDNNTEIEKKSMMWSAYNEDILVEWGDTAQCYKWLHTESHIRYANQHAWFTIPTIVFSTAAGTASFAQTGFVSSSAQYYASITTGTVNILVGILSTIQEYLKISEFKESHRVAYICWDKFARNIKVELAKTPMERADAHHFIKVSRLEYDRLMETSPIITPNIVKLFLTTFTGKSGSHERLVYNNLKKPDICNSIISINDTRRQWFKPDTSVLKTDNTFSSSQTVNPNILMSPFLTKKSKYKDKVTELFGGRNVVRRPRNSQSSSIVGLFDEKNDDIIIMQSDKTTYRNNDSRNADDNV